MNAQADKTRSAILFTHGHAPGVEEGAARAGEIAAEQGWKVVDPDDPAAEAAELCLVLGGDGSILKALSHVGKDGPPVFGVNFGRVGFLAAVDGPDLEEGLSAAFRGEIEVIDLPGLKVSLGDSVETALNDVSFSRRPAGGVAELGYQIAGEEVGHVRCDGLVASTPTGSTGYNLANNGPILAWGVEGYVVSYIAPHSLTARALVVAPDDVLHVVNHRSRDSVEVMVDGTKVGELEPGSETAVEYSPGLARLAQLPGANFYHRIREKFGHLAV